MISSIVIVHAILMTISLMLSGVSLFLAFLRHIVPSALHLANTSITAIGLLLGVILMFSLPLDVRCVVLFGYAVAFALIQVGVARNNQLLASSER